MGRWDGGCFAPTHADPPQAGHARHSILCQALCDAAEASAVAAGVDVQGLDRCEEALRQQLKD